MYDFLPGAPVKITSVEPKYETQDIGQLLPHNKIKIIHSRNSSKIGKTLTVSAKIIDEETVPVDIVSYHEDEGRHASAIVKHNNKGNKTKKRVFVRDPKLKRQHSYGGRKRKHSKRRK